MSTVALNASLLIGTFGYFIENGTVVDAVTAGVGVLPDNSPTSNWPSLECILEARHVVEDNAEEVLCPQSDGGYRKETEGNVVFDGFDLVLKNHNEFVHRLQFGASAAFVQDTPQAPFAVLDRKVTGWLKLQGRQSGGTDRVRLDLWSEMRLVEAPNWGPARGRPVIRCQVLASTLNSVELPS